MTRTELSLNAYIEQRLGHTPREQLINVLAKPFGAVSFAEFWRYGNPVFSYYLRYAVYLPLRPYLPRSLALVFFALLGLVVVVSEAIRLRFTHVPHLCRWVIHGTTIVLCYRLAEYVVDDFLPRW